MFFNNEFMELYEELSDITETRSRYDTGNVWIATIQEDLQEANKIVNRIADSPWYSGSFSGLNDISTRTAKISPEEAERRAKEEEERKLEAERKYFENIAKKAIETDRVPFYNCNHKYEIRNKEYCPAIDLETKEFVYDTTQKEEILKASQDIVDQKRKAAAAKGQQTKANNQAAQAKTYLWTAYYTLGGKTSIVVDKVIGNTNPEEACERVKQKALAKLKQERHECRVFNEPFLWDGKLLITITDPQGNDKTFKQYKFKVN